MEGMDDHSSTQRRDELAAALRAGRELGPEYDEALAASVVENVDSTIDEKVRRQVEVQLRKDRPKVGVPSNTVRLVLSLVTLGLSVPITAIVVTLGPPDVLPLVWLGMIAFYIVSVLGLRR